MSRAERNLLALMLAAIVFCACRIASAQADDATALVLAQAMVAEADFDAPVDHAAIAHTLQRKATRHGLPLTDVLVRYVAAFRVASPRTRWVLALRLDGAKPEHWPAQLAWSAYVARWLAVVERARAFLRGELADPCHAEHWGGVRAGDVPRGRMVIAACSGLTRNTFFTLGAR